MTVSVVLWRIATDTPDYLADDLTGKGAEVTGGRWNRKSRAVVYTSQSIALACLETVVHLKQGGLPFNRYLVKMSVPQATWAAREERDAASLPVGWDAEPAGKVSLDVGDSWIDDKTSALLVVPSVVVPEEHNVLINPAHPDAKGIAAQKVRKWLYDPRLIGTLAT